LEKGDWAYGRHRKKDTIIEVSIDIGLTDWEEVEPPGKRQKQLDWVTQDEIGRSAAWGKTITPSQDGSPKERPGELTNDERQHPTACGLKKLSHGVCCLLQSGKMQKIAKKKLSEWFTGGRIEKRPSNEEKAFSYSPQRHSEKEGELVYVTPDARRNQDFLRAKLTKMKTKLLQVAEASKNLQRF